MLSPRKHVRQQGTTTSLQNVVLAGVSVFTLSQTAYSLLMQIGFAYAPGMTADTVHFILACRLITLGIMAATVIVINKTFFTKH
ncbi:MAG: hypothetical protein JO031_02595 [Ktedonobacteraceae bacterium]|nr:hypothetical protein [Ktedonobacteraceae bacterium]